MLNRLFVVDSVTLTSTGTAVSSYTPWDQTTRKLPTQVVVKATGQGAYVRLSNDASAATNADVLVQGGDYVVLSVQGRRWVSVLSDGASSTVNVGALSTGVSGSAASLDLAFVDAGVLDPRVTFTRTGTTATYFNSAGVLVNAGADVPRFDYNPATLAAQGLLIEEQRTNLLLQSADFTTTWTQTNVTITANSTASPDGGTNGDTLLINAAGATTSQTSQSFTAGSTITVSVFAKKNASNFVRFEVGGLVNCWFDLNTGVTGTNGAGSGNVLFSAKSIQAISNGWYRCVLTVTTSTITTLGVNIFATNADNVSSSIGSNIFLWGAQLEAGAFPTSYIPTTTTALTRSADVASVNTLIPWYNQTEGTVYAELQSLSPLTGVQSVALNKYPHVWQIEAGASDSTLWCYGLNSELYIATTFNNIGAVPSGINKIAVALAASGGQSRSSLNGAAAVNRNGTLTGTATGFFLGRDSTAGVNNFLNGYLRRLTYYPRALSAADLPAITA